jgi:aspartate aminotransferase
MNTTKPVSLNLNVRGLGQSATLAAKDRCRKLRGDGFPVCDFGLGQSPFPVPTPVVEALRLAAPEKDAKRSPSFTAPKTRWKRIRTA